MKPLPTKASYVLPSTGETPIPIIPIIPATKMHPTARTPSQVSLLSSLGKATKMEATPKIAVKVTRQRPWFEREESAAAPEINSDPAAKMAKTTVPKAF